MSKTNIVKHGVRYLLFLSLLSIGFSGSLQAQEATEPVEPTENTATPESNDSATSPSDSIFSIDGGKKLMMEADRAIETQDYDLAVKKLQSARQVFNQLSNFYLQLFNSFSELDNAAAESHRKKALDTSIERDNATYQLALVHRSQNQPELSIPLLIQIITSQSPGVGLGKKAYEQLLEIGFVDVPYTPPKPGQVQSPPDASDAPDAQPPIDGDSQTPSAPQTSPIAPAPAPAN